MTQFDLPLGIRLKELGQDDVESNNESFVEVVRNEARFLASTKGKVTSDDLRSFAQSNGLVPAHPNAWGSVFRGSEWVTLGFTRSSLVSNHARTIRIWGLKP